MLRRAVKPRPRAIAPQRPPPLHPPRGRCPPPLRETGGARGARADPDRLGDPRQSARSRSARSPDWTPTPSPPRDGKTRGAITEPVRQPGGPPGRDDGARTQRRRLDRASSRIPPRPTFPNAAAWLEAPSRASPRGAPSTGPARGLRDAGGPVARGRRPRPWSERVGAPSLDEHRLWVARLEDAARGRSTHFGLPFREGVTPADLAEAGCEPGRRRLAEPVPDGTPPTPPSRSRAC